MKERIILHSDCNGFYASVECLHNPQLRNKPLAVAGDVDNRHGIILAKNEIAKKYNIKTGEAIWQAKNKCPELVVVPPHFQQYQRFSKLAKKIYSQYSDRVENFGLDEAWIDVTGDPLGRSGVEIAQEIRQRIKYELGITVSIGVSFNKIFAKFGSDYKKPDAVTEITKENFRDIVWTQPASSLLYVGRATNKKLENIGIYTIGDIANAPIKALRDNLGKWGGLIYSFANGYDASPVMPTDHINTVKSIGNPTTTPKDLVNNEDVKSVLFVLCDSVCRRMREQGLFAKTVCINVRDKGLFSFTRQTKLEEYTDITRTIQQEAMELFVKNYSWKQPIRSIGISLCDLVPNTIDRQISMIDNSGLDIRQEKLDKTIDRLKQRFGAYSVRNGNLLKDPELSNFNPKEEHTIHPVGYF
jgi:DNA polymerase-4